MFQLVKKSEKFEYLSLLPQSLENEKITVTCTFEEI